MLYKSFVLPYFNYCSTIWFDGNKIHAKKCLSYKSIKSATRALPIRVLMNDPVNSSKCSIELKYSQYYKGMAPEYMTEMFSIPESQTYQLGHNYQKLYLPKPKLNTVFWNQL